MKKLFSSISGLILVLVLTPSFASKPLVNYYCRGHMVLHVIKSNKTFDMYSIDSVGKERCLGAPRAYKVIGNKFYGARGTEGNIIESNIMPTVFSIIIKQPKDWSGLFQATCSVPYDPCSS